MTAIWFLVVTMLALSALVVWVLCCAGLAQISMGDDEDIYQ